MLLINLWHLSLAFDQRCSPLNSSRLSYAKHPQCMTAVKAHYYSREMQAQFSQNTRIFLFFFRFLRCSCSSLIDWLRSLLSCFRTSPNQMIDSELINTSLHLLIFLQRLWYTNYFPLYQICLIMTILINGFQELLICTVKVLNQVVCQGQAFFRGENLRVISSTILIVGNHCLVVL